MTSLEELNNAIRAMAMAAGKDTPAWALNEDFQAWWEDSWQRNLGLVGVPWLAGAQLAFRQRYASVYKRLPRDVRAQLTAPNDIPVAPADDAVKQAIEANQSAFRAGKHSAKEALRETRSTLWAVAAAALSAWLLLRK